MLDGKATVESSGVAYEHGVKLDLRTHFANLKYWHPILGKIHRSDRARGRLKSRMGFTPAAFSFRLVGCDADPPKPFREISCIKDDVTTSQSDEVFQNDGIIPFHSMLFSSPPILKAVIQVICLQHLHWQEGDKRTGIAKMTLKSRLSNLWLHTTIKIAKSISK